MISKHNVLQMFVYLSLLGSVERSHTNVTCVTRCVDSLERT